MGLGALSLTQVAVWPAYGSLPLLAGFGPVSWDTVGVLDPAMIAARVANLVRDRVGVELTLRELFENPILGEQAAILESRDGARSAETTPILEAFEF